LNHLDIPTDTLLCRGACSSDHSASLEKYYCDIQQCLHAAASRCIPVVKTSIQKHWWTPELDDLNSSYPAIGHLDRLIVYCVILVNWIPLWRCAYWSVFLIAYMAVNYGAWTVVALMDFVLLGGSAWDEH